jgi:tRNA-intron endonuclease, archaea type
MEKIKSSLVSGKVSSNSKEAFALFDKERFGEKEQEKIIYSLVEVVYLVENKKMKVFDYRDKELKYDELIQRFQKTDKNFLIKYLVFKDLRKKGNIVKSALKFGAEFRVYEKGSKIGNSHAKWILFCLSENEKISMHEFSAKNRVAHSTNKKLLIAIVDEENDVSYYESGWLKI